MERHDTPMDEVCYRLPEPVTRVERAILHFYPVAPLRLGDYTWRTLEGATLPSVVATSPHGQDVTVERCDPGHVRVAIAGEDCGTYAHSAEVPDAHLRAILDDLVRGLTLVRRQRMAELGAASQAAEAALWRALLDELAGADLGPIARTRKRYPPVPSTLLFFSERGRTLRLGSAAVTIGQSEYGSSCTVVLRDSAATRHVSLALFGPGCRLRDRDAARPIVLQTRLDGESPVHPWLDPLWTRPGEVTLADADVPGAYVVQASVPELQSFVAALVVRLVPHQARYLARATARAARREAARQAQQAPLAAAVGRAVADGRRREEEEAAAREVARQELARRVSRVVAGL